MAEGGASPAEAPGDHRPDPRSAAPAARRGLVGCLPGSFNPPTIAHLGMAETAVRQAGLARVDLVLSRVALGKEDLDVPAVDDRAEVLRAVAASRPWLGVVVTDQRLIVDIARGYDAVVLGLDKWQQVLDPAWYGDDPSAPETLAARDAAVASHPRPLVSPRTGLVPEGVEVLHIEHEHTVVSSTAVRSGDPAAVAWMLPEAAAFDAATGAWSDPDRYRCERTT